MIILLFMRNAIANTLIGLGAIVTVGSAIAKDYQYRKALDLLYNEPRIAEIEPLRARVTGDIPSATSPAFEKYHEDSRRYADCIRDQTLQSKAQEYNERLSFQNQFNGLIAAGLALGSSGLLLRKRK